MLLSKTNLESARFASDDDTRPALQSLNVTSAYVEATNGHALIRTPLPTDAPADFPTCKAGDYNPTNNGGGLIPASDALAAAKALPKRSVQSVVLNACYDPKARLLVTTNLDSTSKVQLRDVSAYKFPNTEQVFPKAEPVLTIGFNGALLGPMLQFLATHGTKVTGQVRMDFYGPDKCVRLTATNPRGQEIVALVMPLRLKD